MAGDRQVDTTDDEAWIDSVKVSLLTCGPYDEVYALYGHTALRIQDPAHGQDWAVNWGIFDMRERFFVPRFVFGLTDYRVALYPMQEMLAEYGGRGQWILEQYVRLSREEKRRLMDAVNKNLLPENVHYRYNYFYDNCTTRPRDILLGALLRNDFPADTLLNTTYREEIHQWNEHHRWARFGNDLLLGVKSDVPLSVREWEFLPDNLRKSFDRWERVYGTHYIVEPQAEVTADSILTPRACILVLAVLVLALTLIAKRKKWRLMWLDVTLMILTGLPGIILFAMLFSQHPTVSGNLQIFLLNPLCLVGAFLLPRKRWTKRVAIAWTVCVAIGCLGNIWQHYAEGITLLAWTLLVRSIDRLTHDE